jgi:hypothetical protein
MGWSPWSLALLNGGWASASQGTGREGNPESLLYKRAHWPWARLGNYLGLRRQLIKPDNSEFLAPCFCYTLLSVACTSSGATG